MTTVITVIIVILAIPQGIRWGRRWDAEKAIRKEQHSTRSSREHRRHFGLWAMIAFIFGWHVGG